MKEFDKEEMAQVYENEMIPIIDTIRPKLYAIMPQLEALGEVFRKAVFQDCTELGENELIDRVEKMLALLSGGKLGRIYALTVVQFFIDNKCLEINNDSSDDSYPLFQLENESHDKI